MKKLALALVAFSALSGTAFAADLPRGRQVVAPMVAAPAGPTWTGFYMGAQLGHGWSNASFRDDNSSIRGNGIFGGLHAGYNWQMTSGVVLGLEGDANYGNLRGTNTDIDTTSKIDWSGSVRARLGLAAGNFMPYITGGASFARITFSDAFNQVVLGRTGWTAGAGVEYMFDRNWSARLEYRYSDFGSFQNQDLGSVKFNTHDIRAGVSYRF